MKHESTPLRAGVAAVDITPPLGIELAGGAFGPAKDVLHPLSAKALFLEDTDSKVLVFACDLLGFDWEYSSAVRRAVSEKHGIPVDSIMLTCTHTHCGPATVELRNWGTPDAAYCADLHERLVGAAGEAIRSAREARVGSGTISCAGAASNRSSGGTTTNDQLGILRVDGVNAAPIAVLLNFACHPVNLHSSGMISPDFPYYVEQDIRAGLGCDVPVLYLSGACGDLNPSNFNFDPADVKAKATGALISEKALQLLPRIEHAAPVELAAAALDATVELLPLPPEGELHDIIEENTRALEGAEERPADPWVYTRYKTNVEWAREALGALASGVQETTRSIPLQAIRIGNAILVGVPGELFSEFGEAIVGAGPDRDILTATLANGCFGYFTSRAAYECNAYEATGCPKYLGTYFYQPDTGERICRGACELVSRLDT